MLVTSLTDQMRSIAQLYRDRGKEDIARSLQGNWREELLFLLRQEVELYDLYQQRILACDRHVAAQLNRFASKETKSTATETAPALPRRIRKPKGNAPRFDLGAELQRITGVDLTRIDGIDVLTAQTPISETGTDMGRWKTEARFASWLGLCPDNRISGDKILRRGTRSVVNRAATALRMAASTLLRSKTYLGAQYRRLRTRLGAPKAITAMAHKLARLVYRLLRYGQQYVDKGLEHYEQRYREQQTALLRKKAASLGFQLTEIAALPCGFWRGSIPKRCAHPCTMVGRSKAGSVRTGNAGGDRAAWSSYVDDSRTGCPGNSNRDNSNRGSSKRGRQRGIMEARTMTAPSFAEADEFTLVARSREGDGPAFGELVRRYEGKIFRLALHVTQNREDAEDVLQETFLKAHEHLDQFQGAAKFYTWIVRIAVNQALMKLRRRRTDKTVSLDEAIDTGEDTIVREVAAWDENPEQKFSRVELGRILDSAIQGLEPAYRSVFVLRDIDELSTEEAADALGLSIPAVKSRLLRARLQLREKLTRHFKRKGDDAFAYL